MNWWCINISNLKSGNNPWFYTHILISDQKEKTANTIEFHPTKGCRVKSCLNEGSSWVFVDDKAYGSYAIYKLTGNTFLNWASMYMSQLEILLIDYLVIVI